MQINGGGREREAAKTKGYPCEIRKKKGRFIVCCIGGPKAVGKGRATLNISRRAEGGARVMLGGKERGIVARRLLLRRQGEGRVVAPWEGLAAGLRRETFKGQKGDSGPVGREVVSGLCWPKGTKRIPYYYYKFGGGGKGGGKLLRERTKWGTAVGSVPDRADPNVRNGSRAVQ